MATKHPLLAHDLNEVRRAALAELAAPYPEEQAFINQATDIFFQVRSDVSGNFYSDSAACLEWLVSLGIKVGVLTNGSADLSRCAYLKNILTLTFTAGEVGTSKPSPIGFMACAQVLHLHSNIEAYYSKHNIVFAILSHHVSLCMGPNR